jgi:hypothetical protein
MADSRSSSAEPSPRKARAGVLRRALDALYAGCAGLAALSLAAIFAVMMAQVGLREAGRQVPGCCCPRKIGPVRLSGWHG